MDGLGGDGVVVLDGLRMGGVVWCVGAGAVAVVVVVDCAGSLSLCQAQVLAWVDMGAWVFFDKRFTIGFGSANPRILNR